MLYNDQRTKEQRHKDIEKLHISKSSKLLAHYFEVILNFDTTYDNIPDLLTKLKKYENSFSDDEKECYNLLSKTDFTVNQVIQNFSYLFKKNRCGFNEIVVNGILDGWSHKQMLCQLWLYYKF